MNNGASGGIEGLEPRFLFALYAPDFDFGNAGFAPFGEEILSIQKSGKLLVIANEPNLPSSDDDFDPGPGPNPFTHLGRLNPDGTLDRHFGVDGLVDLGAIDAHAYTGTRLFLSAVSNVSEDKLEAVRPDGTFDTTFGENGLLKIPYVSTADGQSESVLQMKATPEGGVFVTVNLRDGSTEQNELLKLKPDGTLDTHFGKNGIFFFGKGQSVSDFVTAHGLITFEQGSSGTNLARYKDGKSLEKSFGNSGKVSLPFFSGQRAEQADGKLLFLSTRTNSKDTSETRLIRLNVDGSVDKTFGANGIVTLHRPTGGPSIVSDMIVDNQGRITIATNINFYRYNSAGVLDGFPFDGSLVPGGFNGLRNIRYDSSDRLLGFAGVSILRSAEGLARFTTIDPVVRTGDGVVHITGTADVDDVVSIGAGSKGKLEISLNGNISTFNSADVRGINAFLDDGANKLTESIDVPVTVVAGSGADTITTGDGADSIEGGNGDNVVSMGEGDDIVTFNVFGNERYHNTITGGNGNKTVDSDFEAADVTLGVGNSSVSVGGSRTACHVTIAGGNNTVVLDGAHDVLEIGGNGKNHVTVLDDKNASVTTGNGNDSFKLTGSANVNSNGGNDSFVISTSEVTDPMVIYAGAGNDRLKVINGGERLTVFGGEGDDSMIGDFGSDYFYGEAGKDTLRGGGGSDLLSGGGGKDRILGDSGNDRIYGGDDDDAIDGGPGDDRIFALSGNDKLFGGSGNDQLDGGAGVDTLVGNVGDDRFAAADSEVDHLFGDGGVDTALADQNDVLQSIESRL